MEKASPAEVVTKIAEEAVLDGEEFPDQRIMEAIAATGLKPPYDHTLYGVGIISYEVARNVREGF